MKEKQKTPKADQIRALREMRFTNQKTKQSIAISAGGVLTLGTVKKKPAKRKRK